MNQMNHEQYRLLKNIDILDFTLTDLREYLDTHTTDQDAMRSYQHYHRLLQQAISDYTMKYGPICKSHINGNMSQWKWATQPMPWEGGC